MTLRFAVPGVLLAALWHGGDAQNRSEMAAMCEALLGAETTTTTTMWFATPAYRRSLELHEILLDAIWQDGRTMAAEFQSWLQVRVLVIFLAVSIGLPVLVAAGYKYSRRFRRWLLGIWHALCGLNSECFCNHVAC